MAQPASTGAELSPQAEEGLLMTLLQLEATWLLAQGLGWEGEGANTVTWFFHMPH